MGISVHQCNFDQKHTIYPCFLTTLQKLFAEFSQNTVLMPAHCLQNHLQWHFCSHCHTCDSKSYTKSCVYWRIDPDILGYSMYPSPHSICSYWVMGFYVTEQKSCIWPSDTFSSVQILIYYGDHTVSHQVCMNGCKVPLGGGPVLWFLMGHQTLSLSEFALIGYSLVSLPCKYPNQVNQLFC